MTLPSTILPFWVCVRLGRSKWDSVRVQLHQDGQKDVRKAPFYGQIPPIWSISVVFSAAASAKLGHGFGLVNFYDFSLPFPFWLPGWFINPEACGRECISIIFRRNNDDNLWSGVLSDCLLKNCLSVYVSVIFKKSSFNVHDSGTDTLSCCEKCHNPEGGGTGH